MLESEATGRYYIGHTQDITQRLQRHNTNRVPSTRHKGPWVLVYQEEFYSRKDAAYRERYLKQLKDRAFIDALVRTSR
ncbi:MAG: endonuclease [Desulfobacterales bacterium CG23_combo_of_CG06-09_8_20_14_all_52_9]|nr:MAG: endonuclease [Desulfobacterales bacterium CG23_combo_of_CG06-09_8_20_14_all_52_9]